MLIYTIKITEKCACFRNPYFSKGYILGYLEWIV